MKPIYTNKQKHVIGHSKNIVMEQHIHLKHTSKLRTA